jgi:hypothetical protein
MKLKNLEVLSTGILPVNTHKQDAHATNLLITHYSLLIAAWPGVGDIGEQAVNGYSCSNKGKVKQTRDPCIIYAIFKMILKTAPNRSPTCDF